MTTDKENDAFTAWLVTQSWGQHNQPGFARMAWKARAALDMSEELAAALEEMMSQPNEWTVAKCIALREKARDALTKYRSMKGK